MASQTDSKYYKLTADIDLASHEWVTPNSTVKKYLDGNKHIISNMTQTSMDSMRCEYKEPGGGYTQERYIYYGGLLYTGEISDLFLKDVNINFTVEDVHPANDHIYVAPAIPSLAGAFSSNALTRVILTGEVTVTQTSEPASGTPTFCSGAACEASCTDVLSNVNVTFTGKGPKAATTRIIMGINYNGTTKNCLYLGQLKDEYTNSTYNSHCYICASNATNSYYLNEPSLKTAYDSHINATKKTETEIKSQEMVDSLNNGRSVWSLDTEGNYLKGFPVPLPEPHVHDFTYTASDAVITATCGVAECPLIDSKVTLTLVAPALQTYGGTESEEATLNGAEVFNKATGKTTSTADIEYYDGSTKLDAAPTEAGDSYSAKLTVENQTAVVNYQIAKATLTADDFTFTADQNCVYDGTPKNAEVTSKKDGTGDITIKYYKDTTSLDSAPSDAGEYTVKIDVAESDNYNAITDLTADTWSFEITPKTLEDSTITVADITEQTYSGEELKPEVEVKDTAIKVSGEDKVLEKDVDYEVTYSDNINASKDPDNPEATATISGKGNYTGSQVKEFAILKADPEFIIEPTANELTYTGKEQELITAGETDAGEIEYVLSTENGVEPPEEGWTSDIPKATDSGEYYVWSRIKGNDNFNSKTFDPIAVTISKANQEAPEKSSIKPTATSSSSAYDGIISGVNDKMEYSTNGGKTWNAVPEGATQITGLNSGTVLVRYKETKNHAAGPAIEIVIETNDGSTLKPAGSNSILLGKVMSKGKKSIGITWTKVQGADGYDIFFARCNYKGKKNDYKIVKSIEGNNVFKWKKTGLKKGIPYKTYVKAYVMESGQKKYINKSPTIHTFTGNGNKKYTNAKSVTVKKNKVALTKGKTYKIKAKVHKVKKGKKLVSTGHAPKLRYMTSDSNVATVSKNGKITANGTGSCTIYVLAHNGISKQVKVTVQ